MRHRVAAIVGMPRAPELIRYLVDHPNSSRGTILAGTGIPAGTLSRMLTHLEQAGVVQGSHPGGPYGRRGYPQSYRVDVELIRVALRDLESELLSPKNGLEP